uniref:C2H2-type domain-containing protein n=2 Tax=Eptatretus burgeri TaxID=7764 RepID=A0A8C4Q671_EPTBU
MVRDLSGEDHKANTLGSTNGFDGGNKIGPGGSPSDRGSTVGSPEDKESGRDGVVTVKIESEFVDDSFPPYEEKEMKIVSFTNSAQFDQEGHFNQQIPSSQDNDRSSRVSSNNYRSCLKVIKQIQGNGELHKCFVCNKAFTTSSTLHQHKLVHSGNKSYQCSVYDPPPPPPPPPGINPSSVLFVTRHLINHQLYINMNEYIPGINHTSVLCVTRRLINHQLYITMNEYILGINPTSVLFVTRRLINHQIYIVIKIFISGQCPTSVFFVTRHLVIHHLSINMNEYILGINPTTP